MEEAVESPQLMDALRAGEPSFEALVMVPLRSAERLLGMALLYYGLHAALPSPDTQVHLGFLARELASPLEASAAREAAETAARLRVLSHASAAAVASLLARLPSDRGCQRRTDLADVLEPLQASGVVVEVKSGPLAVLGDAPLLRFTLASLVHLCEVDALEHGQAPDIVVRAAPGEGQVNVTISGRGRPSALPASNKDAEASDATLSVVQSVVDLHGGQLIVGRSADQQPEFTLQLSPA
jgi:hypothetical protein